MFSKACEYGIKATLYIAHRSEKNERVSLKNITKAINSPEAFTAKILQELVKSNIIDSMKGPGGGFQMDNKRVDKITLSHIVKAIDGDDIYCGCGLGLEDCNEDMPCPVHEQFKNIKENLRKMLETTSVKDLTSDLNDGLTFLK